LSLSTGIIPYIPISAMIHAHLMGSNPRHTVALPIRRLYPEGESVRSIRLAVILSALSAGAAAYFLEPVFRRWTGLSLVYYPDILLFLAIVVSAYTFLALSYLGKLDPVVAWAASAWQKADYQSALLRVWLFSWAGRRAPFTAFLLTSANLADRAYAVAANSTLPKTDMEEPSYDLDFASGRAALALRDLDCARHHFARLHDRFPGSALARYAFGDLLLWKNTEVERAHQLLTGALADSARFDLPHWKRLGLEAELHASHAWSVAVIDKPEQLQDSLDKAIQLAGGNKPVLAAVHLRLGYALRALNHPITARQHWDAARAIDPQGWAGNQAARELESHS
jgi:tetratricopeptide (TPR) repeat protein